MALLYNHPCHTQRFAIWKVEEPETFFTEATGLLAPHKLEKRRLEYLVPRFLLQQLQPDICLENIYVDEYGKPRLAGDPLWFSFTHSHPFVAVMVQQDTPCGIDLQVWHPRMRLLQKKFLTPSEQRAVGSDEKLITAVWCAKEAVYKCVGRRVIVHNEELQVVAIDVENKNITLEFNSKELKAQYDYYYMIFNDFVLSYNK